MNGFVAILLKEFSHIRREPTTLFFAFVIPVIQITIFGYAIDTTINDIRTVSLDLDGREPARLIIDAFRNSRKFRIVERVSDQEALEKAIISGRAKVGITIPPDFSERLLRREQAQISVVIDGSDSQVATTALNSAKLIGLDQSLRQGRIVAEALQLAPARDPFGQFSLPVDVRPKLLFNPDLKSEYFFVPALVGIILQLVTLFLTSFAIVRERELGTLEQLFVTPVGRGGLVVGKLIPYAMLGFGESLLVMLVMVFIFQVPIQGNLFTLLVLVTLFLFTALGLGLLVSTVAQTQLQAVQLAFVIMLPSILLSGFMFPRESMPLPIYLITFLIPATYFLEILRGVILRSAGFADLLPHIGGLTACCVAVLSLSILRFRKQID